MQVESTGRKFVYGRERDSPFVDIPSSEKSLSCPLRIFCHFFFLPNIPVKCVTLCLDLFRCRAYIHTCSRKTASFTLAFPTAIAQPWATRWPRPARMSQLQFHCPASPMPAAPAPLPLGQPQPGYSIPCASSTLPSESASQPIRSSALPAGSATPYSTTTGIYFFPQLISLICLLFFLFNGEPHSHIFIQASKGLTVGCFSGPQFIRLVCQLH